MKSSSTKFLKHKIPKELKCYLECPSQSDYGTNNDLIVELKVFYLDFLPFTVVNADMGI